MCILSRLETSYFGVFSKERLFSGFKIEVTKNHFSKRCVPKLSLNLKNKKNRKIQIIYDIKKITLKVQFALC